ncbi:hypothetical protein RND71_003060 [Anisodus tanguticus]|uniref:NB-ARC domain-containing protein n=1 Tax=Anisodus tanguticus TaxID=243964 RepID=A0AAE1VWF2_9SOLA|nr:hypothetical protein RND71_003060 [Anisodus tanguticus]
MPVRHHDLNHAHLYPLNINGAFGFPLNLASIPYLTHTTLLIELIQSLVKRVLHELSNSPMVVAPFVVGIDYSLKELIRQLDVKRNGVKILGLHGIGVGKTTLSKALYNKLACHFTHRTFILNVKEIATQQGIISLQKKIIKGLFPSKAFFSPNNAHEGRVKFRQTLQEKRILLVLDDVDYVSDDVNILKALKWRGNCELAILDLSESQIERIGSRKWTWSRKAANKLIVMNVSDCHKITAIPDLSMHKALEKLITERCSALQRIHRTIGNLKTLRHLNLRDCRNLVEIPGDVSGMKNLEMLILSGCSRLKQLPEDIAKMKSLQELLLYGTAIEKLPQTNLWLYGSAIEIMPESIGSLYYLRSLSLGNCQYLTALPVSIKRLSSLVELQIDKVSICSLPDHVGALNSLKTLEIRNCEHLGSLPHSIGELLALKTMTITGNDAIMELPESVGKLQNLVILRLTKCKRLWKLPASIGELKNLVHLLMEETAVPQSTETAETATYAERETTPIVVPSSFSKLSMLEELNARAWRIVGKILDDFEKLSSLEFINLDAANCGSLECIRDISKLEFLRKLNLANCMSLVDIQGIQCLKSLRMLHMAGCNVSSASIVRSKLDKYNFSSPGSEIPSWFTPSEVHFSRHNSNEIKAVIIALVVSVNCAEPDELRDEFAVIANIFGKVVRANRPVYTTGFSRHMKYLCVPGSDLPDWFIQEVPNVSTRKHRDIKGVIIGIVLSLDQQVERIISNTKSQQLWIFKQRLPHQCSDFTIMLEEGDKVQVAIRECPRFNGLKMKKHGMHLVFENEDNFDDNDEDLFDESQQSVPKKLANFFNSL